MFFMIDLRSWVSKIPKSQASKPGQQIINLVTHNLLTIVQKGFFNKKKLAIYHYGGRSAVAFM